MDKKELLDLIGDHVDEDKVEVLSIVIGLITTVVALTKQSKSQQDKLILGAILVIVAMQSVMLIVMLIWLK